MRWQFFLFVAMGIALTYPCALVAVIVADTLAGEAEFMRQVLFVSKREVVVGFARDWWSALAVAMAFWLLVRGAQRLLGLRSASWMAGAVAFVGIAMSFIPPYVPMIFGAMLLVTVLLNILAERRRGNG